MGDKGQWQQVTCLQTLFLLFLLFFKITFPILEDVLLKKSQFKIVLKTYLKIGL